MPSFLVSKLPTCRSAPVAPVGVGRTVRSGPVRATAARVVAP